MITFSKPRDVKPFMTWVVDLHYHLGVGMTEAFDIAHETWTRPDMESERTRRKDLCQQLKEVLRSKGGFLRYDGARSYLPSFVRDEYGGRLSRVWAAVDSERASGISKGWSDIDHFNAV